MSVEMNFREFMNGSAEVGYDTAPKSWRMEKDQIMQYWQQLRPNDPIAYDPMKPGQKGSTFGEDGLRLTGSRRFIDSVLGRVKDIMHFENPSTKLNVVYRQVQYRGKGVSADGNESQTPEKTSSFVFYAQVKSRDKPQMPLKKPKTGNPNGPQANPTTLQPPG